MKREELRKQGLTEEQINYVLGEFHKKQNADGGDDDKGNGSQDTTKDTKDEHVEGLINKESTDKESTNKEVIKDGSQQKEVDTLQTDPLKKDVKQSNVEKIKVAETPVVNEELEALKKELETLKKEKLDSKKKSILNKSLADSGAINTNILAQQVSDLEFDGEKFIGLEDKLKSLKEDEATSFLFKQESSIVSTGNDLQGGNVDDMNDVERAFYERNPKLKK